VEAHEDPESINWPEFKAAFRAHHVPQGVIKLRKEFQDLKQGYMSVNECHQVHSTVSLCSH
jgi:hypothetical protein